MTQTNSPGGKLLQVYLMASYLYYQCNTSPITDEKYDRVCRQLIKLWDTFEHQHKHLVTLDDLEAGTGYALRYPLMVKSAAQRWADTLDTRKDFEKGGYMS